MHHAGNDDLTASAMPDAPLENAPPPTAAAAHYARLARRMAGATSNLLATGVVLAVALGAGRELLSWWGVESSSAPSRLAAPQSQPLSPTLRLLEFGDAPFALERDEAPGDAAAALAHLRRRCREAMAQVAPSDAAQGPAEVRLLSQIRERNWKPVEEIPGEGRLYQSDRGLPLVLGICEPTAAREHGASSPSPRLVVWAMAVPQTEGAWTAYLCRAAPHAKHDETAPLPPTCQRTLAISGSNREGLIAFRGGTPSDAVRFYDDWFARRNGRVVSAWREVGGAWRAEFAVDEGSQPTSIEIQLMTEPDQTQRGLLSIHARD